MLCKDKLIDLLESLNDKDKNSVYEFIQSLLHVDGRKLEEKLQVEIIGKDYYVVQD